MNRILIVLELNNSLKTLDSLNTCGKALCIKDHKFLSLIIDKIRSIEHIEDMECVINEVVDHFGLNDLDDVSIEVLKSKIYSIFTDVISSLEIFKLEKAYLKFNRRIGKQSVLLQLYSTTNAASTST